MHLKLFHGSTGWKWIGVGMDGWMDGWMDEWMKRQNRGRVCGWIDGWMDGKTDIMDEGRVDYDGMVHMDEFLARWLDCMERGPKL